jgi:CHAD domain-containing protein
VAGKVVAVRTDELFARDRQVLVVEDIDALHDMRVASRRLRAALEFFGPCFPRHECTRALREIKRLAEVLGARRDIDVQIQWLRGYAEARTGAERAAVLGLVSRFTTEQANANNAVARALAEIDDTDLRGRLNRLAQHASEPSKRKHKHARHRAQRGRAGR